MPVAEISPADLFLQAGPVVKFVVACLIAASVWCWFIIFDSLWSLVQIRRAMRSRGNDGGGIGRAISGVFAAGHAEAEIDLDGEDITSKQQRIVATMKRRGQEIVERCQARLPNLAVIASVAPFLGLFGTVWGIMTSFIGIAAAKDTSLAVVAPGIAEALAATAIGLAAAIPASFAYNRLAASFNRYSRALNRLIEDDAAAEARRLLGTVPLRRRSA